jgi:hypothetical protein
MKLLLVASLRARLVPGGAALKCIVITPLREAPSNPEVPSVKAIAYFMPERVA